MPPKPTKNVKVRTFSITVSPAGDILPGVYNHIAAYLLACSFEHHVVLESDCKSSQLHLHAFVMLKENRTTSNFAKQFKRSVFKKMEEFGQQFNEKCCIKVGMCYNSGWIEEYLAKEDGVQIVSSHLEPDNAAREEAYALVPDKRKNVEYNHQLTRLVEQFHDLHPEIHDHNISFQKVCEFVWKEQRECRMQVMFNPTVMIRFCRALRGFILKSESYDFSRTGPETYDMTDK